MTTSDAHNGVERFVRSTLTNTIDADALALIAQWASSSSMFSGGNNLFHPPEEMFDPSSPFFPLLKKIYNKVVISGEGSDWWSRDPLSRAIQEEFVITSPLAVRFDMIKCQRPALRDIRLILRDDCADIVLDILRFCKDVKSLKISHIGLNDKLGSVLVRQLMTSFMHTLEEMQLCDLFGDLRL